MSVYKDASGRWHAAVMLGGKRAHRTLAVGATSSDAKRQESKLTLELSKAAASSVKSKAGDPGMTDVLALYAEHSKGRGDEHAYLRLAPWARLYKASEAADFAAHVIRDMRAKNDAGKQAYADATINRSLATAKKGLSLAFFPAKLTPVNYCDHIRVLQLNNARETFLSVDEVRKLASFCTVQAQAAIWFALLTGARRGEILKLKKQFVSENTITLTKTTTKSKRTRVIPIVDALRPWLEHFPLTITVDEVTTAWRRARRLACMPHARFHDLRHSCASILIACDVDLYTISQILGHADPKTTQRYAHLQVERKRTALDKLSALVDA